MMFKGQSGKRAFIALVVTYTLDMLGFSIAFPVLAPLLLNTNLHFFSPDTTEIVRTTVLGLLFAIFGLAQFICSPLIGVAADHYGRRNIFLVTIVNSAVGYLLLTIGVYMESLALLFLGRIWTGCSSGNVGLSQSAAADITHEDQRGKAFGILLGIGAWGWIIGPWLGGKLSNPLWVNGSGAFLFSFVISVLNYILVWLYLKETWERPHGHEMGLSKTFKDMWQVFENKRLRGSLIIYFIFTTGWGFYLIFCPTYFVQRFSLTANVIGDLFVYMAFVWFIIATFVNKELLRKFSLSELAIVGTILSFIGIAVFLMPDSLWPYWLIIPLVITGGAMAWTNVGTMVSNLAPAHLQGRALGVSASLWSLGQIISSLVAGPLAGINIYLPLSVGSLLSLVSFILLIVFFGKKLQKV